MKKELTTTPIRIEKEVYKQLKYLKLDLDKKNINEVLIELLNNYYKGK